MDTETVDLNAYFMRIGYRGAPRPDLRTLQALHYQHVTHIPFENLNPFLGRPVQLDVATLQRKLVAEQRGGYCYEHNLLFAQVLGTLGFEVTGLAARVLWNQPEDTITPRTHMLLGVEINDRFYLADTGFGAMTLTSPLVLEPDRVQNTSHEPYRLRRQREEFVLEADLKGNWKPLYRFELVEQFQADYELTSWYLSNHPESHFVNSLIVSLPAEGCRYTLHNDRFSVHYGNGRTERRMLDSPSEVRSVLDEVFGLSVADNDVLEEKLAGLRDQAA